MAPKQLKLVQGINFPPEFTAGLDEAGRGCLAGPVAAAAVILPAAFNLPGLDDSKKLSPAVRERLQMQIRQCAVAWSIGVVWPGRIAKVNILNATFEAMARAAAALKLLPRLLLVDGKHRIPAPVLLAWWPNGAPRPCQRAIVGGDSLEPAISAASIIAKTWRDRLMLALDRRWPGYGFARHKGYGTKEHLAALRALGPCPAHRLTFRGVLQSNSSPCLL